ncbi:phage major tail tube protein [Lysinibacillus sphaericus]|uniref:Phage tail tube protein FII-like protein n=1 Tax=Lysinibacillus sphaericus OT4b.31 TaxID=1285586 RepID=R7Z8P6_LYSSH|nr:phage major tail tube protein [Lysinibacillus sphaericus]EON70399.1 Phage tail tube protein FII-like protein [Lysinibacillus sphaericus OT4b.31]
MLFPEKLNEFRVFANDKPNLLGVSDIELPELNSMTETVNGAGIYGEYESPNYGHLESMQLKISWRVITDELTDFYKPDGIKIDCRLVNQHFNTKTRKHEITPSRVLVHGAVTKNSLGKVEKGSPYEGSSEVEIHYIKIEDKGKVLYEYDRHNYIYKVDDVDYGEKLRELLGIL